MCHIGGHFHFASDTTDQAAEVYRREVMVDAVELNLEGALFEHGHLTTSLVSLTTRERELIPEYGNGLTSIHNLDAVMRNATGMIDAARTERRLGYKRTLWRILVKHADYRFTA